MESVPREETSAPSRAGKNFHGARTRHALSKRPCKRIDRCLSRAHPHTNSGYLENAGNAIPRPPPHCKLKEKKKENYVTVKIHAKT